MLIDTCKELTANQFEAAFCTLNACVMRCPEDAWHSPVVNWPFSNSVFHTLFFADLYLETGMGRIQEQQYHQQHREFFGEYDELEDRDPARVHERAMIEDYLRFCRAKAQRVVAAETEAELLGPSGFDFRPCSRAELHVYNVRHIYHHAAQLSMRLRLDHEIDIPWIGHAWKDV